MNVLLLGATLTACVPASSRASVDVVRTGAENPVVEVSRSTTAGALAGLFVGLAIVQLTEPGDGGGELISKTMAIGTIIGLVSGITWVSKRPPATAMLDVSGEGCSFDPLAVQVGPDGSWRARMIGVTF